MGSKTSRFGATLHLSPPSVDGLGVKCWRVGYTPDDLQEVTLFRRPKAVLPDNADSPWMLRIETRSGAHVETRFYKTRAGVKRGLGALFRAVAVTFH